MYNVCTYKSNMPAYVLRRVLVAVIAFFVISLLIFYSFHHEQPRLLPYIGLPQAEEDRLAELLDIDTSPFIIRYVKYMGHFFTGDWGESLMGESYYAE